MCTEWHRHDKRPEFYVVHNGKHFLLSLVICFILSPPPYYIEIKRRNPYDDVDWVFEVRACVELRGGLE